MNHKIRKRPFVLSLLMILVITIIILSFVRSNINKNNIEMFNSGKDMICMDKTKIINNENHKLINGNTILREINGVEEHLLVNCRKAPENGK